MFMYWPVRATIGTSLRIDAFVGFFGEHEKSFRNGSISIGFGWEGLQN
jgi:hypothetical protein